MAANDTDRRRFLLATALTLLALPALWWANQQADSGAPNVATAGLDVGDGSESHPAAGGPMSVGTAPKVDAISGQPVGGDAATTVPVVTAAATTAPAHPSAPIFLDGPSGASSGTAEIVTPAAPTVERISTTASYRSTISPRDSCLVANVATGTVITVVNLNNGHSVTCVATRVYVTDGVGLVLFTETFAQIADLTDAPIPVEISQ